MAGGVGSHCPLEPLDLVEAERRLNPGEGLGRERRAAIEVDDQPDHGTHLGLAHEDLGAPSGAVLAVGGSAVEAATKRVLALISRATATQASTSAAESGSNRWTVACSGSILLI
jgi:hypothetical protein